MDYLSKYLSKPPAKKTKKTTAANSNTLIIDNEPEWEYKQQNPTAKKVSISKTTHKTLSKWKPLKDLSARESPPPSDEEDVIVRKRVHVSDNNGAVDDTEITMSDGTLAGLQSGSSFKSQLDRQRKIDQARYAEMDQEKSGKFAETVHRDKHGRKVDPEKINQDIQSSKAKALEEKEALDQRLWKKHLSASQKTEQRRIQERLNDPSSTFTISASDHSRNEELKQIERWGDPSLSLGASSSSVKRNRAKCKFQGPPNRFNIEPGCRWDGHDRSNGFEVKYFRTQNEDAFKVKQGYKWSSEDM